MPTKEKLKTLQDLFSAVNNSLTKKEFTDAFAAVLKIVKDIKDTNIKELEAIKQTVSLLSEQVKNDATTDISAFKGQVSALVIKALKEQEDGMNFVHDKVSRLKQAKDGETPSREELLALIEPLIPKLKQPIDGKTPTEEELLALVEPLIPKIEDIAKKVPVTRVQTPAKAFMVRTADCSSQCDGSNKTFTVGGSHFGIVGVYSTEAPGIYRPIIDYTETVNGFLLTDQVNAPASGQTLICQFLK